MAWVEAWRLVVDPPGPGEANMRRDLALAEAVASGRLPPVLRLYGWAPPAVSVGRHQDPARVVDLAACRALGWDVVRRPTGGRAVLHARDEVTYAVAVPAALAPAATAQAFAWLAQGLVAAYRRLGVPAELAAGGRPSLGRGACFASSVAYEVVACGRKLAGSAQLRREGYLLQHGSLPLAVDVGLHARLLGLGPEEVRALEAHAAGLWDFVPGAAREDLVAAVVAGFEEALGVAFEAGPVESTGGGRVACGSS